MLSQAVNFQSGNIWLTFADSYCFASVSITSGGVYEYPIYGFHHLQITDAVFMADHDLF